VSGKVLTGHNTVFGTNRHMDSHIFNVGVDKVGPGKLTGYAYLLDFDPGDGLDSQTYGIRYKGEIESSENLTWLYTAEYAHQSDYSESGDFDADYGLVEAGVKINKTTFKIGYEHLGSDNGNAAFQTPLATLHAFNGWADKFLNTPDTGLEDVYIQASTWVAGVKLIATYHDFTEDQGSSHFGNEIDLVAVKKFGKYYKVGAKYAYYDADDFATDTQKVWVFGSVSF